MRRPLQIGLGALVVILVTGAGVVASETAAPNGFYLSPIGQFVALSRDGRTLTTFAATGPCGEPQKTRLLVRESRQRVELTLLVKGEQYSQAQLDQMICALDLRVIRGPLPSVRLAMPLGSRLVLQGLNGNRITVYGGASIALPTVLPVGCKPGRVTPIDSYTESRTPPYKQSQHPGLTWSCEPKVPFPRRYSFAPASELVVDQSLGWVRSLGLPIQLRTQVHGHPALVKIAHLGSVRTIQARSISWRQDGETFVITSYSGLSLTVAHSQAVLSAQALIRIADGMRILPLPRAS
jgi:hypothetical protein